MTNVEKMKRLIEEANALAAEMSEDELSQVTGGGECFGDSKYYLVEGNKGPEGSD